MRRRSPELVEKSSTGVISGRIRRQGVASIRIGLVTSDVIRRKPVEFLTGGRHLFDAIGDVLAKVSVSAVILSCSAWILVRVVSSLSTPERRYSRSDRSM